ncbi:MAG: DNA-3-methyladenine glycosylase 2 family protein [Pseudomonadales bacterium]|nr:DNA-3-methyladenine glycosylase 2 family protein [Pseudomonadales bacterium]
MHLSLRQITSRAEVLQDLQLLVQIDQRLEPILAAVDDEPLRLRPPGFAGLAHIVVAPRLSVASAKAISGRLNSLVSPLSAANFLAVEPQLLLDCGLSKAKLRTLTSIAQAELQGQLCFTSIGKLEVSAAIAELCVIKGIGPWTAQVYLLFCSGHPDIFPAGDLALQKAVAHAQDLADKPNEKQLREIAAVWSPYRGSAARLMWAYYAQLKNRQGIV